jgi:hypothetical protein
VSFEGVGKANSTNRSSGRQSRYVNTCIRPICTAPDLVKSNRTGGLAQRTLDFAQEKAGKPNGYTIIFAYNPSNSHHPTVLSEMSESFAARRWPQLTDGTTVLWLFHRPEHLIQCLVDVSLSGLAKETRRVAVIFPASSHYVIPITPGLAMHARLNKDVFQYMDFFGQTDGDSKPFTWFAGAQWKHPRVCLNMQDIGVLCRAEGNRGDDWTTWYADCHKTRSVIRWTARAGYFVGSVAGSVAATLAAGPVGTVVGIAAIGGAGGGGGETAVSAVSDWVDDQRPPEIFWMVKQPALRPTTDLVCQPVKRILEGGSRS